MGILALGWDRPLGGTGQAGWDWWALAGFLAVFLLLVFDRRPFPLGAALPLALLLGLIVADLTHAWGVVPVWGTLALVALMRNRRRGEGRPSV